MRTNDVELLYPDSLVRLNADPRMEASSFERCAHCHATGEIGNKGGPVFLRLLKNHRIFDAHYLFSNTAAFRIDFSVPAGTSSLGFGELR